MTCLETSWKTTCPGGASRGVSWRNKTARTTMTQKKTNRQKNRKNQVTPRRKCQPRCPNSTTLSPGNRNPPHIAEQGVTEIVNELRFIRQVKKFLKLPIDTRIKIHEDNERAIKMANKSFQQLMNHTRRCKSPHHSRRNRRSCT